MTITVEDHATPDLQAMMSRLRRRKPLMQAMGKAVEVELHRHFTKRDGEGNKHGWPSRHFWNRTVRKATAYQGATDDEATVSIASKEFIHKLHGGPITASGGKYLAIPLTARAYQVGRPKLWPGGKSALTLIKTAKACVLIEAYHSSLGKRQRGKIRGGEAQYLLVKRVNQKADPRALPTESKLQGAAMITARNFLSRAFPIA
jgi:hypothetical protein